MYIKLAELLLGAYSTRAYFEWCVVLLFLIHFSPRNTKYFKKLPSFVLSILACLWLEISTSECFAGHAVLVPHFAIVLPILSSFMAAYISTHFFISLTPLSFPTFLKKSLRNVRQVFDNKAFCVLIRPYKRLEILIPNRCHAWENDACLCFL